MATARKALSKKTRFDVFKRDGFKCLYCGSHPPQVLLHVDHVVPVAGGGTNAIDNLVTACEPCNLGKGARGLEVVPQSLADKAAQVAEREAQLLGYQKILEDKRSRIEDECWRVMHVLRGEVDSVPRTEFQSVKKFIELLGVHEVLDAADIAVAAKGSSYNMFRYFCGVCWRKAKE